MQNNVNPIAIVNSIPILAVPRCADRARLPNDKIVVSALKVTALGVLVCNNEKEPEFPRARMTICIPLATPSPIKSGRTMTFAKLKAKSKRTATATVKRAARING